MSGPKIIATFISKLGSTYIDSPAAFAAHCASSDKTTVISAMNLAEASGNTEFIDFIVDACKVVLTAEAKRQTAFAHGFVKKTASKPDDQPRRVIYQPPPGFEDAAATAHFLGLDRDEAKTPATSFAKMAAEAKDSPIAATADDGFKPLPTKAQITLANKFAKAGLTQFTKPLKKIGNKWLYENMPAPTIKSSNIPDSTVHRFRTICSVSYALGRPLLRQENDSFAHEFTEDGFPKGFIRCDDDDKSYLVPDGNGDGNCYGITRHENNTFSCFRMDEFGNRTAVSVELMIWVYTPKYYRKNKCPDF